MRRKTVQPMPWIIPSQASYGVGPIAYGRDPFPKDPGLISKKEGMDNAAHEFEVG